MNLRPYYPVLRGTSLLRGMRDDELDKMLDCFAPRVRRYQKGEFLMLAGYETKEVGILLEGQITALKNTPDGSSVAITEMGTGGLFGDVLSGSSTKSPVSVMAQTDCLAIYLPYEKIIHPCAHLHESHLQLLQNLVLTISNKYFALDRRVELLICKSLGAHQPVAAGTGRGGRAGYLCSAPDPGRSGRIPELRPQRPEPGTGPHAAGRADRDLPGKFQNSGQRTPAPPVPGMR